MADWDYGSAADMLAMAREALERWRKAPAGRAAERHAGRSLAFAFGRLDDLCDLAAAPEKGKGETCSCPPLYAHQADCEARQSERESE
jgi:hypothetical protein